MPRRVCNLTDGADAIMVDTTRLSHLSRKMMTALKKIQILILESPEENASTHQ